MRLVLGRPHAGALALFKRIASAAAAQGVACELISTTMRPARYPIMRTDDLVGALWLPGDAKANPTDMTQALAKGARMGGAKIFEKTRVTAIDIRATAAVTGVRPQRKATITAEIVVNCAGQWAQARSAAWCGVTVPLHSASTCTSSPRSIDGVHARPAGDARSGRLHLLQGRGRRPADGRLRACGQAVGHGRHSGEFRVRHVCPTTGTSSKS